MVAAHLNAQKPEIIFKTNQLYKTERKDDI